MNNDHQMVSIKDAASMLSVSERTIRKWLANGTFPRPVHLGRQLRWQKSDLVGWSMRDANARASYVTHVTKEGASAFRLLRPRFQLRLGSDERLAVFQDADGHWHTRPFRTQTVWNAGPELLELSCEDTEVSEISAKDLPPIMSTSD